MWWAVILVGLVTYSTHNLYEPLASMWPDSRRAAEEIYYVMRGLEGVAVFGALLYAAASRKATEGQLVSLTVICVYGAAQEALTSICGIAYMMMTGVGKHANDRSAQLCDAATGWSWVVVALAILTGLVWLMRGRRRNEG